MRKWVAVLFLALVGIAFIVLSPLWPSKMDNEQKTEFTFKKHEHLVGYIDPSEARLNDQFQICDESRILQYYNPQEAVYSLGKNGLRDFILKNYVNQGYRDSGYLTIRFVINCKGEAGRYVMHQNNLDLNPTTLDHNLVEQLFELTVELQKWTPNFYRGAYRDSYMYINYRIENGNITEILP
nr:hypothetical protein [Allomuricauda sp.]